MELTDLMSLEKAHIGCDRTGSTGIGGWERCQAVYETGESL